MVWSGGVWQEIAGSASGGGVSNTGLDSVAPSLDVDSLDNPVVAWQEEVGSAHDIYLRQWSGGTWIELDGSFVDGGVSNSEAASFDPAVAVDALRICVSWTEAVDRSKDIMVRCFER